MSASTYRRLTQQECTTLASQASEYCLSASIKTPISSLRSPDLYKAVFHAQSYLPIERRLSLATLRQPARWSELLLNSLASANVLSTSAVQDKSKPSQKTPAAEDAPPVAKVDAQTSPASAEKELSLPPNWSSISISQLCEMLAVKIAQQAETLVAESIRKALAAEGVEAEESLPVNFELEATRTSSGSISRPRFLIVGLIPAQALIVSTKVSTLPAEFRFQEASSHTIKDHARWADYILVMSKFVSHETVNRFRSCARSAPEFINGGTTGLVAHITRTLNQN